MHEYLVDIGKARAMLHDQVAQELGPGSYFGEIAFLATCSREMNVQSLAMPFSRDQLRTCDVVASEYTEVWELTAADFLAVVGKVWLALKYSVVLKYLTLGTKISDEA